MELANHNMVKPALVPEHQENETDDKLAQQESPFTGPELEPSLS